ncbi:hypothetical protein ACUNEV_26345 [Serratia sp. IR-2025]
MTMILEVKTFPSIQNPWRYILKVNKWNGLCAEYIIEFRNGDAIAPYLAGYYSQEELRERTLMVDFFDIEAIHDITGREKFAKFTDMHYSPVELERFFIEGIAEAIFDVVEQTKSTIIFGAPLTEALARYYHRLLKKYAEQVNYKYREDIRREANFYVIETERRS